jgi:uncharacterized membrane protein YgdD (TMEM256/DUF423 family)
MELAQKREKLFLVIATLLGALTVAIGAYGAHAGSKFIVDHEFITFIKGVRYQMFHIVGLLVVAYAISRFPQQLKLLTIAGWLFVAGILLFSGSLYIIVFFNIKMGYITPTGGTAFILGWLTLAYAIWKA